MPPSRNKRSRKQEQAGAERLGGRRVTGSGNGWATKNDVRTDDLSVEYKYTDKKSFSLKEEELLKAEKHALLDSGREFAFVIGFGKQVGSAFRINREFVVVGMEHFESLRRAANGDL